ncbi:tRNA (adenosine(37)-N6)-dimethylallyltransferase MiaA [Hoylesella nanceiensis]|uniref:tRNA (adenosine(37)-N6)-dimethylallyltransferase MiaA n=1 Tax=Hoylesella nanceiensis TaxID=425941 RepID=UPI0028D15139|nr:tRNA (adenosine(37)-N6)-dimethylallyltransferase MiaA [Hoylesella nanceiensis]
MKYKMITILGPTASGKTSLVAALAYHLDAEIISADSRQVYQGMDIGTGKDLADYTVAGKHIPYHLIDICKAGSKYNVYQYQQDFLEVYNKIRETNKLPILCGGSGLYLEAILKGYHLSTVPPNEELRNQLNEMSHESLIQMLVEIQEQLNTKMHNSTDLDSKQRTIRAIEIGKHMLTEADPKTNFPEIPSLIIGVDIDREERRRKITTRLHQRLEEGMIEEVKQLLNQGIAPEDLIYYGLEYKFVTEHIIGKLSYDEMVRQLEIAIHQFAKRQMTWFRGMERRGIKINWINASLPMEEKIEMIQTLYKEGNKDESKY